MNQTKRDISEHIINTLSLDLTIGHSKAMFLYEVAVRDHGKRLDDVFNECARGKLNTALTRVRVAKNIANEIMKIYE